MQTLTEVTVDRSFHNDGHPLASIAKQDSLSPTARSFENNFPAELTGNVAPTQIDIDLTSDISRTSQEEIIRSSCCNQKEVYHDNGNNSPLAKEINAKELTTCSGCLKETKHKNIHNQTLENSQILPQALIVTIVPHRATLLALIGQRNFVSILTTFQLNSSSPV